MTQAESNQVKSEENRKLIPAPSTVAAVARAMAVAGDERRAWTSSWIAERTGYASSTVTRTWRWMEKEGLVVQWERRGHSRLYALTPKGVELAAAAPRPEEEEEGINHKPRPRKRVSTRTVLKAVEVLDGRLDQMEASVELLAEQVELLRQMMSSASDRFVEMGELLEGVGVKVDRLASSPAVPPSPARVFDQPCSHCGVGDVACVEKMRRGHHRQPCCSRCANTATHGQDSPGYVHPDDAKEVA